MFTQNDFAQSVIPAGACAERSRSKPESPSWLAKKATVIGFII